jgi:hypothetical protein
LALIYKTCLLVTFDFAGGQEASMAGRTVLLIAHRLSTGIMLTVTSQCSNLTQ